MYIHCPVCTNKLRDDSSNELIETVNRPTKGEIFDWYCPSCDSSGVVDFDKDIEEFRE